MAAKKDAVPLSARALLRQKMTAEEVVDEFVASYREALASTKDLWVMCRKCGTRTAVEIPMIDKRVSAFRTVIEEYEGKVGTQSKPPPVQKVSGDLDELSDDELLALLNAEDEHGEADTSATEEAPG